MGFMLNYREFSIDCLLRLSLTAGIMLMRTKFWRLISFRLHIFINIRADALKEYGTDAYI